MRNIHKHLLAVFRLYEQDEKTTQTSHSLAQPTEQLIPLDNLPTSLVPQDTPLFSFCQLPTVENLKPSFIYGAQWGARLLWYLSRLEWPTNEPARQTCQPVALGDILLDFIFSTSTLPPKKVIFGHKHTQMNYVLDKDLNIGWNAALTIFGDSLLNMSRNFGKAVIPGLEQNTRVTWLQVGSAKTHHRGLTHGPKSLLTPQKVTEWKNMMLFQFKTPCQVVKQDIRLSTLDPPAMRNYDDELEYTYKSWQNLYVKTVLARKHSGTQAIAPKGFSAAAFIR